VGNKRIDPFYGKNVWPDEALKRKFTAVNEAMYEATLRVLRGCDQFLERDHGPLPAGRLSLEQIATKGTALAGRWIWYDSAFSRDDNLMEVKPAAGGAEAEERQAAAETAIAVAGRDEGDACSLKQGGGGDGLASMRTAATAVRTTGAGDGAKAPSPTTTLAPELGRYWLPWHIDSQFITLLTSDDFYDEVPGSGYG
jgi:hypothetical protein